MTEDRSDRYAGWKYGTTTKFNRFLLATGIAQGLGFAFRTIPRPFFVSGVVWSMAYSAVYAEKVQDNSFEFSDLAWEAPGVGLILLGILLRTMISSAAVTARDIADSKVNMNTERL